MSIDNLLRSAKKFEKEYGSWDKVPFHLKSGVEKYIPNIQDRLDNWEKDSSWKGRLIRRITNRRNGLLVWLDVISVLSLFLAFVVALESLPLAIIIVFFPLTYIMWRTLFISCNLCLFQVLKKGVNTEIQLTSSGYRHTKKGGGKDLRYKNNSYWYHYNEIYPCYNCNRKIIYPMINQSLPESNNVEIETSFSYKYNSLVKKVFISVIIGLIAFPIIVEALENPPYKRLDSNPAVEITEEEPAEKEYNAEENYSNGGQDEVIKKDTIINTDKVLYKINDPDGWTNMRLSPGGEIIRTVDTLERFEVIGAEGNWKMIKLENNDEGFIHNSRIVIAE